MLQLQEMFEPYVIALWSCSCRWAQETIVNGVTAVVSGGLQQLSVAWLVIGGWYVKVYSDESVPPAIGECKDVLGKGPDVVYKYTATSTRYAQP